MGFYEDIDRDDHVNPVRTCDKLNWKMLDLLHGHISSHEGGTQGDQIC